MSGTPFAEDIDAFVDATADRLDGRPLVLMLDIDGTLAPIAPRPEEATVPQATRDALRRIVALPDASVAFISGRSAADASRVVGVDGAWIVGNHGLELRSPRGPVTANAEARTYESATAAAVRALAPLQETVAGALVEDKRWSLSVHYRLVDPAAVPVLVARARAVADATGLRVTEGKMVVELRPPVSVDKGTAAIALAERLGALSEHASLLVAGDDRTDEDAFLAVRDRSPRAVTVRIQAAHEDVLVPTRAEFLLGSPDALRRVLDWLIARRAHGGQLA